MIESWKMLQYLEMLGSWKCFSVLKCLNILKMIQYLENTSTDIRAECKKQQPDLCKLLAPALWMDIVATTQMYIAI